MQKSFLLIITLIFPTIFLYAAETPGDTIGPAVSEYDGQKLKWEEGNRDFFFMFKSLLERNFDTSSTETNMQPDTCIDQSTFTLLQHHIPADAHITDAFLIWQGAQPSDKLDGLTDHAVTLSFSGDKGHSHSAEVTASTQRKISDNKSFEFEGLKYTAQLVNDDKTGLEPQDIGYFTYRVEITDFFKEVHSKGIEAGATLDGESLHGDYTVSGLTCTDELKPYLHSTIMVSNWAIFFVYTSSDPEMTPKKIYVYNGFDNYRDSANEITVSGFQFPENPTVRMTLMVSEGDSDNAISDAAHLIPEGLDFRGDPNLAWAPIFNICHPHRAPFSFMGQGYYDIYNSISSLYTWNSTDPYCIGGLENDPGNTDPATAEWALDVDTFILTPDVFPNHLKKDDTDIQFSIKANNDLIFTNMMVVSMDTKPASFDIPEKLEKNYCSCSTETSSVCNDRPFYFTIRVENWGESLARNVKVKDELPHTVEYIPGTTEYTNQFDTDGLGANWKTITDAAGGAFPLASPYLIAESLEPCLGGTCPETYLVRFKVKPSAQLSKKDVVKNIAEITDDSGVMYRTNSDVPLRLTFDKLCPSIDDCPEPDNCNPACGGCSTETAGGNNPVDNDDTETNDSNDSPTNNPGNKNSSENDEKETDSGCNILVI